ncbi:MAG: nucleotidyl transferase AbiEii/AbiGii toxin family protein [Bacteroidales bacterium]|nr:nucleotidyl transferase AbiEii/AbiGii toxin family protein [Bacteroidales bacterium]
MIPISDIRAWSNVVPWINDEQIEQDLIISRSLVEIFSDDFLSENLVFRGGTALHKLYLNPQPRYSEDIDLVQTESGPIKEIFTRLRNVLSFLGKPVIKQKTNNNTLIFRFNSENTTPVPLRLKVEINCREHFTAFGYKSIGFNVDTNWFKGSSIIQTYELEELLGTKFRALYQRKKGRDLYDLYKAFVVVTPDSDKIITCYKEYMKFVVEKGPTRKQFLINLEQKITDSEFLNDTVYLLRPTEKYDPEVAFEIVKKELIEKM